MLSGSDFPLEYRPFYSSSQFSLETAEVSISNKNNTVLLRNGTIWTGNSFREVFQNFDILIIDGKIILIGPNIENNFNAVEYQLEGKYVTPGLVDMHSHLGVYSYPEDAHATQDGNEMTNPALPQVRALDALNPNDPAIPLIRSGGVTTSLVLPGSGNVMGGEAVYVKLRGNTVGEMLIPNSPRALKMACGENPKGVYGSQGKMPMSRMGIGWVLREKFFAAAQLKQQQEQWDCLNKAGQTSSPRPVDLALEPLVSLLNHRVYLMVHCYKVQDLEMMMRTADEFNFSIAAFHHALEAWKIPELLKRNSITAAIFSDLWGYKLEAYWGSVHAPVILTNAGVNVALKTDHPVLYAKYFVFEAAKAFHYGLPEQLALATVTINPAKAIGLGDRIGSIEIGKDGDIAVWDRYPFSVGATVDKVFIEGELQFDKNLPFQTYVPPKQAKLVPIGPNGCNHSSNGYAVTGVTIYTMNSLNEVISNGSIVVENGTIICLGPSCPIPPNFQIYEIVGGFVVPGMVNFGANIGQLEVEQEENSQDGVSNVSPNILAIDGILFQNFFKKHMKAAWSAGVTVEITGPQGSILVAGVGVAYYTYGITIDGALISNYTSLHIHIGNDVKQGQVGSISGQIAAIRDLFASTLAKNISGPVLDALNGEIPVVAQVNQADEIASMIRLKKQFGFQLIIAGGAEAYILANILAEQNISVILAPPRSPPNTFETWEAISHPAVLLYEANVTFALGITDPGAVRNLRWEAGFVAAEGVPYIAALESVTKNPLSMFGLPTGIAEINQGTVANFVVFSADPLAIESQVQFIAFGNIIECLPVQY